MCSKQEFEQTKESEQSEYQLEDLLRGKFFLSTPYGHTKHMTE